MPKTTTIAQVDTDDLALALIRARAYLKDSWKAHNPALQCVLLECLGDGLRILSTDGYRMALSDIDGMNRGNSNVRLLASRSTLDEMIGFASGADAERCEIAIFSGRRSGELRADDEVLPVEFASYKYPDYRRALPEDVLARTVLEARASDLRELTHRVIVDRAVRPDDVTEDQDGDVAFLRLSEVALTLRFTRSGIQESVEAKIYGETRDIALTPQYLLDALKLVCGPLRMVLRGYGNAVTVEATGDSWVFVQHLMPRAQQAHFAEEKEEVAA